MPPIEITRVHTQHPDLSIRMGSTKLLSVSSSSIFDLQLISCSSSFHLTAARATPQLHATLHYKPVNPGAVGGCSVSAWSRHIGDFASITEIDTKVNLLAASEWFNMLLYPCFATPCWNERTHRPQLGPNTVAPHTRPLLDLCINQLPSHLRELLISLLGAALLLSHNRMHHFHHVAIL